jgi:hypothetical protein
MFDAAFTQTCADHSLPTEIIERFIASVGMENPLAISITSGNRVILPEPPESADEAARLAQRFIGSAVVRAGVTNFPVGVGISDVLEITADLFDACKNVGMGTALFGKVYRIVAHARGVEDGAVLRDALEAWRTGQFEGAYVFAEPDPGPVRTSNADGDALPTEVLAAPVEEVVPTDAPDAADPNTAGIRVTLPAELNEEEPF